MNEVAGKGKRRRKVTTGPCIQKEKKREEVAV